MRRPADSDALSRADLRLFTLHLKVMLAAGIGQVAALNAMSSSYESGYRTMADRILRDIERGHTMSHAMDRLGAWFPKTYVRLVQVAELSGSLVRVLDRLNQNLEFQDRTRNRILHALTYPGVLLASSVAMVFVLIFWLLPLLLSITAQAGAKTPWLTLMLVRVARPSIFFGGLTALLVLWFGFKVALRDPRRYERFRLALEHIPGLGAIWVRWTLLYTLREFATMLESGLDLMRALRQCWRLAQPSLRLSHAFEQVNKRVREGESLAVAMAEEPIFPRSLVSLLSVGEESGHLGPMVYRYCDLLEQDLTQASDRLTQLVEPLVLLGLGLVVGTLILAAFLPVYSLVEIK